ncbi:hypothetical protein F5Y10DRAFT_236999 [Nemania abortiva]|nr:hypothetical protein F5Y10DRAFT_236999 [Nemania abortiva]
MLLFLVSAVLVWSVVLTFFIMQNLRVLFQILRWSVTIWLVIFGILMSEVLREGLDANGDCALHHNVCLAWTLWFFLVICAILDWRFLVPVTALLLLALSYDETRTLMNGGLVRLKWLDMENDPFLWAAGLLERLGILLPEQTMPETATDRVASSLPAPVNDFVNYIAGWVPWRTSQTAMDRVAAFLPAPVRDFIAGWMPRRTPETVISRVAPYVPAPARGFADYVAGLVLRATEESLQKLQIRTYNFLGRKIIIV